MGTYAAHLLESVTGFEKHDLGSASEFVGLSKGDQGRAVQASLAAAGLSRRGALQGVEAGGERLHRACATRAMLQVGHTPAPSSGRRGGHGAPLSARSSVSAKRLIRQRYRSSSSTHSASCSSASPAAPAGGSAHACRACAMPSSTAGSISERKRSGSVSGSNVCRYRNLVSGVLHCRRHVRRNSLEVVGGANCCSADSEAAAGGAGAGASVCELYTGIT